MIIEEQIKEAERTLNVLSVALTEIDLVFDKLTQEHNNTENWLKHLKEQSKLPNGSKESDFE